MVQHVQPSNSIASRRLRRQSRRRVGLGAKIRGAVARMVRQPLIDSARPIPHHASHLDKGRPAAGYAQLVPKEVEDLTVAIWERELGVHAKGVFLGTRSAIPAMRKGGGGSIINTSSVMGIVGSPTSPAYSAAKGAITIFTKSAALQYAKENIRINSVHPGYADTPLTEQRFSDPAVRQALIDRTPMGRLGTADDIANGVLFLASDESSWVTGSELVIDGGMTAQ